VYIIDDDAKLVSITRIATVAKCTNGDGSRAPSLPLSFSIRRLKPIVATTPEDLAAALGLSAAAARSGRFNTRYSSVDPASQDAARRIVDCGVCPLASRCRNTCTSRSALAVMPRTLVTEIETTIIGESGSE